MPYNPKGPSGSKIPLKNTPVAKNQKPQKLVKGHNSTQTTAFNFQKLVWGADKFLVQKLGLAVPRKKLFW